MEVASEYVRVRRRRKALAAEEANLKAEQARLEDRLKTLIERGDLPVKFSCDGANVHLKSQVWASPARGHKALAAALQDLGLTEYLPSTVNSQSFSAYVRDHDGGDDTADASTRFADLDPRLRDVVKISDNLTINATGL